MRIFGWLLVIVVVLACAVAWRAPATLANAPVEHAFGEAARLTDAQGTVWDGGGTLVAGQARLPLRWRVHPASLVRGELALTISPTSAAAAQPRGQIVADRQHARVRNLVIEVPASLLANALTTRPRLDAEGTVEISSPLLEWPPADLAGAELRAFWRGARVGLAGGEKVDLGNVVTTLRPSGGRLTGPVRNTGGDFAIDGELSLLSNGGGSVRGFVRARRPDDPRRNALTALGTPEGNGVRLELRWPGR